MCQPDVLSDAVAPWSWSPRSKSIVKPFLDSRRLTKDDSSFLPAMRTWARDSGLLIYWLQNMAKRISNSEREFNKGGQYGLSLYPSPEYYYECHFPGIRDVRHCLFQPTSYFYSHLALPSLHLYGYLSSNCCPANLSLS